MSTPAVTNRMIETYARTFVNRLAYSRQRNEPDAEGRAPFFLCADRNDAPLKLGPHEVQQHLHGSITIGLYAISLKSTVRWLAIDADYPSAIEDLNKLKLHFAGLGISSRIENSRRGGHLWIFCEEPLPADASLRFLLSAAAHLNIPVKGSGTAEGLEMFPRQASIAKGGYGSAIRGPLGVHRKNGIRYWFADAAPNLADQFAMIRDTPRLTAETLNRLAPPPTPPVSAERYRHFDSTGHRFSILDYIRVGTSTGRVSGNYVVQCPSCARHGRDPHRDNLHILMRDPAKYLCRGGCTADDIRGALGAPPRTTFIPRTPRCTPCTTTVSGS